MFVEKLFGLTLGRAQVERGRAFVAGVLERIGRWPRCAGCSSEPTPRRPQRGRCTGAVAGPTEFDD
ncbi:MAG: hypothetical protein R2705_10260 [Ilumatobacteraceae bacterium]